MINSFIYFKGCVQGRVLNLICNSIQICVSIAERGESYKIERIETIASVIKKYFAIITKQSKHIEKMS